jgi:hypothetical protein
MCSIIDLPTFFADKYFGSANMCAAVLFVIVTRSRRPPLRRVKAKMPSDIFTTRKCEPIHRQYVDIQVYFLFLFSCE